MRMLRWMCTVTAKDEIRNEHGTKGTLEAPVPGKRRRGRQKTRWKGIFDTIPAAQDDGKARGGTDIEIITPEFCGNYRGTKMIYHTMKIWERIIDRRLREETR